MRRVQDSILNLSPDLLSLTARQQAADAGAPELFDEADDSLRFVGAPSAARELEGLVDWLQAQFQADPTLTPSDVLVVTPDISAAAPLIDQVFGSLAQSGGLPTASAVRFRRTQTCRSQCSSD